MDNKPKRNLRPLTTDEVDELLRDRAAREILKPADHYRPGNEALFPREQDRYQLQFHRSVHTVRMLVLGNGAGKTTVAGVEVNWWATHSHPHQDTPKGPVQMLWVAQTYKQIKLLRQQLERRCFGTIPTWNENDHTYTWGDKKRPDATLTIISNDSDWGAIQGINPDLVVIDEECNPELWQELQMRRRGDKLTRYVISATATKGKRWMYHDLYVPWLKHHADQGVDEDRAMRVQNHPRYWVWSKGGIRDNPTCTAEMIDWYENGVRYRNPMEKVVRLGGGFVDLNQAPVFDLEAIDELEKRIDRPGIGGQIIDAEEHDEGGPQLAVNVRGLWYPAADLASFRRRFHFDAFADHVASWFGGSLTLFEQPRDDAYYVMGMDFGQGLSTGDFDAAVVCRKEGDTLYQAAEAEGRWGQTLAPHLFFMLGYYFNQALLVGEANSMGLGNLQIMYRNGYTYQYVRPKAKDSKLDGPHDFERLGYFKGSQEPIQRLQRAIAPFDMRKNVRMPARFVPRSPRLIGQFRRFQWRPRRETVDLQDARDVDLIWGAPPGENDDLVSAAAMAELGGWALPLFKRPEPVFVEGTLGRMLRHQELLDEDRTDGGRPRSPFRNAKGVRSR